MPLLTPFFHFLSQYMKQQPGASKREAGAKVKAFFNLQHDLPSKNESDFAWNAQQATGLAMTLQAYTASLCLISFWSRLLLQPGQNSSKGRRRVQAKRHAPLGASRQPQNKQFAIPLHEHSVAAKIRTAHLHFAHPKAKLVFSEVDPLDNSLLLDTHHQPLEQSFSRLIILNLKLLLAWLVAAAPHENEITREIDPNELIISHRFTNQEGKWENNWPPARPRPQYPPLRHGSVQQVATPRCRAVKISVLLLGFQVT